MPGTEKGGGGQTIKRREGRDRRVIKRGKRKRRRGGKRERERDRQTDRDEEKNARKLS